MDTFSICLEMGGTHLRLGILAEDLSLIDFVKLPTAILSDAQDKITCLEGLLRPRIDRVGAQRVSVISMALASLMDKERSIVYSSPMVRGFDNIPLKMRLEERLGLRVVLEKDVNLLLLYEIEKQALPKEGIVAGFFLGTGLGNALCIDGKVYSGFSGAACELGHIPVSGLAERCGCGKDGCIELKACGRVLDALAENFGCPVGDLFLSHAQAPEVLDVLEHYALAIGTEVGILDPACVLLGGGVLGMPGFPLEWMLNRVRAHVRAPYPRSALRFALASGDEVAGVVGAAMHATQRLVMH